MPYPAWLRAGVVRSVWVPSPSCPWSLRPQVHTSPLDRSATVNSAPAATCLTPDTPGTWCGAVLYWAPGVG